MARSRCEELAASALAAGAAGLKEGPADALRKLEHAVTQALALERAQVDPFFFKLSSSRSSNS